MFESLIKCSWMRPSVLLWLLAPILTACAASSPPPMIVSPLRLPEPDMRWMQTPELPASCATWSACAQSDIQRWQELLMDTGAL